MLTNQNLTKSLQCFNLYCRTLGKDPCSRPKLSDFFTPSQTKWPENHTLYSGTYPYSLYLGVLFSPGCHAKGFNYVSKGTLFSLIWRRELSTQTSQKQDRMPPFVVCNICYVNMVLKKGGFPMHDEFVH